MSAEAVVHVVDDDLAVRQSLAFLLASDGLAVRLYETATAFLERVEDLSTGCILTDVRMPGIDGLEFLRRLRLRGSVIPVVVMTGHADVPMAVEAMKEGADDFIEKPFGDDVLLAAIRSALNRGERRALQDAQALEVARRVDTLSEREGQVLDRLVQGKANKVIAYELGISPRTVEIYRANVMAKMQAASLSELVRLTVLVSARRGYDGNSTSP